MKELEELIAKLSAQDPPGDKNALVTHESWADVARGLATAAKNFEGAAHGLRQAARRTPPIEPPLNSTEKAEDTARALVLAEVTTDLGRESIDLARRAVVRRGLAPNNAPQQKPPATPQDPAMAPPPRVAEDGKKYVKQDGKKTSEPQKPESQQHPKRGITLTVHRLYWAQRALTNAMDDLSSGHGDPAAESFVEELDVLTEMTIGVRRRVDEVSEMPDSSETEDPEALDD